MYIIFPTLLVLLIVCSFIFHSRKKKIIHKINCMPVQEKLCLLNKLCVPLGFRYDMMRNIFTSCLNAWQRDYGYGRIYDENAVYFNMVFDCQPVYFDYNGHTWLLEFWKGQYGINIGAEIGIYRSERLLTECEYASTLFQTVPDAELPAFSYALYKGTAPLYQLKVQRHWWLTGFCLGQYAEPELLRMDISIDFKDCQMADAFMCALKKNGYNAEMCKYVSTNVSFTFYTPKSLQPRKCHPVISAWALWKNKLFLALYCHATKPFCHTMDKLLYLYEFLPFVFRHMLQLHPNKKRKGGR